MKIVISLLSLCLHSSVFGFFYPKTQEQAVTTTCEAQVPELGKKCEHFKKILESGVSQEALKQALMFQHTNPLLDQENLLIADYSKNSSTKRMFKIDLNTGDVVAVPVSHGGGHVPRDIRGSTGALHGRGVYWGDRDHNGMIDRCEMPPEITRYWPSRFRETQKRVNMTMPGFFAIKTPKRIDSQWLKFGPYGQNALPVQGLTEGLNTNAEEMNLAFNVPRYNSNPKMGEGIPMGRGAHGPALRPRDRRLLASLKPNTIFYSYVPVCEEDMNLVKNQVVGWENICEANLDVKASNGCVGIGDRGRHVTPEPNDQSSPQTAPKPGIGVRGI